MKYDFVALGDVTSDAFIKLRDAHVEKYGPETHLCMRFGDKIPYDHVDIVHGVGNAANAAVSASRLGVSTALVTDIGTDQGGDECVKVWERDHVATEYVRRHKEWPTHYHFVLRFGAERTILIKHEPWPYNVPTFSEAPSWIYFTSTGEHGEQYHHDLAAYVQASGTKLAFQPGTFQIQLSVEKKINDIYAASELFFCNKEEAQRILGSTSEDIVVLMRGIKALGPKMVSVTDGPKGAYAMNDEGAWRVPMYPDPAPPVSRTGAGDAYASTVTAFLALGMSLPEALIRGPINSMSVVQQVGAQKGLLARDAIEELLKNAPHDYVLEKVA
jgi:ribokinase